MQRVSRNEGGVEEKGAELTITAVPPSLRRIGNARGDKSTSLRRIGNARQCKM